ncbi:MAG: response regulator [Vicinamibacteria bacterium]
MRLGTATATRPRLLVIDDEEPILFAAKDYFETKGFAVDCAREVEEAEALLSHVSYAAMIADLRLTGAYGTEGLSLVRFAKERHPETRVVLLTAYGSREVEAEALRLGVDCFLLKPKPLPDLAQIVAGLVGTA